MKCSIHLQGHLQGAKQVSKQIFQTSFAYHWHTNQTLLAKAFLLDEADYYADPGGGQRSVHLTFFHLLTSHRGWRVALESGQQPAHLQAGDFPTREALQSAFMQEQEAWRSLLDRLTDQEIAGTITLTDLRGATREADYWRVLQHLILHGMQHHTELADMLTRKGQSPGDIDFIFYG